MKMPLVRLLTAVAVAVAIGACAPAAPPDTTAEDMAAINAVRDAWGTAYNAGDAAALAALYADDAVTMGNGEATLNGRAAIQADFENQFSETTGQVTIQSEATDVSGSLAYDSGTYTGTVTPKAGGDAMTQEGRYIVILKKGADGTWKLVRDMSNSPTAPMMSGGGN